MPDKPLACFAICRPPTPYLRYFTRPPTITTSARPINSQPANGVFALFERNFEGSTVQRAFGSMIVTSASAPMRNVPLSMPRIWAGASDILRIAVGQSRWPGSINLVMTRAERRFQADDAEGGLIEFLHLLFFGVRGVVAGDRVDRAVDQPGDDRLDVFAGPAAADSS